MPSGLRATMVRSGGGSLRAEKNQRRSYRHFPSDQGKGEGGSRSRPRAFSDRRGSSRAHHSALVHACDIFIGVPVVRHRAHVHKNDAAAAGRLTISVVDRACSLSGAEPCRLCLRLGLDKLVAHACSGRDALGRTGAGFRLFARFAGSPSPGRDGTLWFTAVFGSSIGIPFFALSAEGPLQQFWFPRATYGYARDPFFSSRRFEPRLVRRAGCISIRD